MRLRFDPPRKNAASTAYRIDAAPGAPCAARLPGCDPTDPCLLFRQDDGAQADLVIEVKAASLDRDSGALVRTLRMQRTVITDMRPGGGVVRDRTKGSWDVATWPLVLVCNGDISGSDWRAQRMTGRHRLAATPPHEVLRQACLAPSISTVGTADKDWQTAPWRARLMASAHDLPAVDADPHDQPFMDLAIYFKDALFDRPLPGHEELPRWKRATSRFTRARVRNPHQKRVRRAQITPDGDLLREGLESPEFDFKKELAVEIEARIKADQPGTRAAPSDRYLAAVEADAEAQPGPLAGVSLSAPRDMTAIRAALPSTTLGQRASILIAACTAPPSLRGENTLGVQAVKEQMVTDLYHTGHGFDDHRRVRRHLPPWSSGVAQTRPPRPCRSDPRANGLGQYPQPSELLGPPGLAGREGSPSVFRCPRTGRLQAVTPASQSPAPRCGEATFRRVNTGAGDGEEVFAP